MEYKQYNYHGTHWLKDGFSFPGLYQYIEQTKEKLRQPLHIPEYATANEGERIKSISEKLQQNPYLRRAAYADAAKLERSGISNLRTISFDDYPSLYEVCVFASKTLTGVLPLIFLYTADEGSDDTYNAMALDYMDKVWVYISDQLFKEQGMFKDEELSSIVGHELGHAQCHHATIASAKKVSSDAEYSADRAGMIVCARWIMEHEPQRSPDEVAQLAVLYSSAALLKMGIAATNGRNKTDWSTAFDYDKTREYLERIFDGASKLTVSTRSHPHTRHRIMAMVNFSQSQLFYRCLGLDPSQYQGLLTDKQLQTMMAYQLKSE